VRTVLASTLPPCVREGIQLTPWPLSSSLELGALPTAVPCARLHAKQLAWEWGLSSTAETIELLVSELTTNAVHAVAGLRSHPAIRLRLFTDSTRIRIEVWDADQQPPVPNDLSVDGMPDLEAESGRGLFLVTVLSDRWDWASTKAPQGKTVWCELYTARLQPSAEIDEPSVQPRLPQRIPSRLQVRPPAVINDLDILRRLRDGLRNLDRF
jgi:anti-sigma regulatory factor (Ser/Thr protein kinase)